MQPTFGMIDDQVRRKKITMLDQIAEVIDFRRIEKILLKAYKGGGRPPIPPIMLFKALLLESWYDLSDVEVALEIHDRRSFERFIGPEIRNYHLDDTTLVKFRNRLREKGVLDRVWKEVDKAMTARNLRVKKGVIIDSTMVEGGCRPESKRADGEPVDPDADYVKRGEQMKSGYKVHISTDDKHGFIRRMELVPITENDQRRFGELIPDDAGRVYADKGYASEEHDYYLLERGIRNRVLYKAARGRRLLAWQEEANRRWSRIRSKVEAKFADLKRWCSMDRMRYYGMERNRLWMLICGLACNLKRAGTLAAA